MGSEPNLTAEQGEKGREKPARTKYGERLSKGAYVREALRASAVEDCRFRPLVTPLPPLRFVVPLSEEEQRALAEIERTFYEEDPTFVRAVRGAGATANGQPVASRPVKGPRSHPDPVFVAARPLAPFVALALVGAVLMTIGYSVHVVLGFFGVCILFAGLLLLAFELKRRVQSSIAAGGVPLSERLAARVDAQRALRERQAEQIRQAQIRRNGQQPPPNSTDKP
jgi:Protein of unknown function (DUF3040)